MTIGMCKKYSKEFKLDAVSLVIDQGYFINKLINLISDRF